MPPNALSSLPASAGSTGTQPADSAGQGGIDPNSPLAQSVQRASASAVGQHIAESPRPKRGQSAGLPLASVGDGTGEAPLEEGLPVPLTGLPDASPPFDEAMAREVVETIREIMNDSASAIVRAVALHETNDALLAENAANEVRMSEGLAGKFDRSGVMVAKKYNVAMTYAPELMLGGCVLAWGKVVSKSVGALRAKGAEIRGRTEQQRKAA